MSTQVVFTGTAKNDLREIAVHLAKRSGSRELAVRFVRELQGQTAILVQFPESGAFPQDRMLKSSGFRFLTHKDYLLFYRYERAECRVYIMAISTVGATTCASCSNICNVNWEPSRRDV